MSHLLNCACGGQFAIAPQQQPTGWLCPHCGAVCYAPTMLPDSVPAPPPIAPVMVAAPPVHLDASQIVAPPVASLRSVSHVAGPTFSSATARRRSQNPVWLVTAIAAIGLLFALVLLSLPQPNESAVDVPRKKKPLASKPIAPPSPVQVAARPIVRTSTPDETPRENATLATLTVEPKEEAGAPSVAPASLPPVTEVMTPVASAAISSRVAALVQSHCVECHDGARQEGGLRMDDLAQRSLDGQTNERWRKVLRRLKSEEMPPPEASTLSIEDRSHWVNWLQSELYMLAESEPARPTMRRLNRAEYVNTVRALTGLPLDMAAVADDVISTGFDTDAAELNLSPQLMREYVQLARAIAVELRSRNTLLPGMKFKLFGAADQISDPSEVTAEARRRLQPFAESAFRRPVEPAKLERLTQIVVDKIAAKQTFDDGMQLAVQAVLCSPQFLLLTDLNEATDDYALAAKLSYFLWSGPPDAPLYELAEKNLLRDSERLEEQATRMLKDPRSGALADNFGGQWLGTRELGVMQPDEEIFPYYTPLLEASFREETHRFFEYVLRQDLSITTFLDADFAIVNEPLAQLYGIPNVRGIEFRKVSLKPQQHRGGILTQGTMLSITSDGVSSSPVIRGVWILENILGDSPPPPPADVPDLESDTRGTKSIREELARHRQIDSCNSCHRKIDPLGFALENYDAIGQFRTHYRSDNPAAAEPVDNKGELPDGTTLTGIAPLKRALLQRKRDFARCLAEKLLAYGCGRKLDIRDDAAVEQVVAATEASGYRLQAMIQAVVQTPAFRGQR